MVFSRQRSLEFEQTGKLGAQDLGELLRVSRTAAGFTEEEAAAALGMPPGKVAYIELGYVEISAVMFCRMLQFYGWNPSEVFSMTAVTARQVRKRMARELRASANELLEAANDLDFD